MPRAQAAPSLFVEADVCRGLRGGWGEEIGAAEGAVTCGG